MKQDKHSKIEYTSDSLQNDIDKCATQKLSHKRNMIGLKVMFGFFLSLTLVGATHIAWKAYKAIASESAIADTSTSETTHITSRPVIEEGSETLSNPIDFAAVQNENPDVYAWIYIPNTQINYPILQHPNSDNLYLEHDSQGNTSEEGAIYTQASNSTCFSDPVTLIYGHTLPGDTRFTTLHYFENTDFFNANEYLYIYTPDSILTYKIASAYMYDDRHILNSFDFSDPVVLQEYFDYVTNPDSLLKNTRTGIELDIDDKIVQLSTCFNDSAYSNNRYILTGVLVSEQPTI